MKISSIRVAGMRFRDVNTSTSEPISNNLYTYLDVNNLDYFRVSLSNITTNYDNTKTRLGF